jgi:RNA polymerase sigma-70 factor (ECF subfamily)
MTTHDQTTSDEALLSAWRDGDQRAGELLFSRHLKSMARFFIPKVGHEQSEDLVQDTFLGLREGLDRFRGESSVRTLLYAIARNKLNYYFRQLTRDRARFVFDAGQTSLAAIGTTPTQRIAGAEQDRLLLQALRELPVDTQVMLELHYWEQIPVGEIATIVDQPINTVKARMYRGRRQLDAMMAKLADSPEQLRSTMDGLSAWAARLRDELGPEPEPEA